MAVIVPVKSFTVAKGRLSDVLTPQQRLELAQSCAETVVRAAHPFHIYIACSDDSVAEWARSLGADVVHCPTPGLDAAVATSRDAARRDGFTHVIVAHADLPLATSFSHVPQQDTITAISDRHRDGTNVLSFPINSTFATAYGPGSFDNHKQIAHTVGLPFVEIIDNTLELDLDTADDLTELSQRKKQS